MREENKQRLFKALTIFVFLCFVSTFVFTYKKVVEECFERMVSNKGDNDSKKQNKLKEENEVLDLDPSLAKIVYVQNDPKFHVTKNLKEASYEILKSFAKICADYNRGGYHNNITIFHSIANRNSFFFRNHIYKAVDEFATNYLGSWESFSHYWDTASQVQEETNLDYKSRIIYKFMNYLQGRNKQIFVLNPPDMITNLLDKEIKSKMGDVAGVQLKNSNEVVPLARHVVYGPLLLCVLILKNYSSKYSVSNENIPFVLGFKENPVKYVYVPQVIKSKWTKVDDTNHGVVRLGQKEYLHSEIMATALSKMIVNTEKEKKKEIERNGRSYFYNLLVKAKKRMIQTFYIISEREVLREFLASDVTYKNGLKSVSNQIHKKQHVDWKLLCESVYMILGRSTKNHYDAINIEPYLSNLSHEIIDSVCPTLEEVLKEYVSISDDTPIDMELHVKIGQNTYTYNQYIRWVFMFFIQDKVVFDMNNYSYTQDLTKVLYSDWKWKS